MKDERRLHMRIDPEKKGRWHKWAKIQGVPVTELVQKVMDEYMQTHNVKGVHIGRNASILDEDNEMCYDDEGQFVGFPGEELYYESASAYGVLGSDDNSNPFEGKDFSEWDEE